MARFRKKQIVVEAAPYEKGMEDGVSGVYLGEVPDELLEAWYGDAVLSDAPSAPPAPAEAGASASGEGILAAMDARLERATGPTFQVPYINTPEGRHYIRPTDMIVTGIMGERYPVKKEIFEATYEPDAMGALPSEIYEADKYLNKANQDYMALGRFIMPIRNKLGELSDRWGKGERTLQLCQEIMAIRVPQA